VHLGLRVVGSSPFAAETGIEVVVAAGVPVVVAAGVPVVVAAGVPVVVAAGVPAQWHIATGIYEVGLGKAADNLVLVAETSVTGRFFGK